MTSQTLLLPVRSIPAFAVIIRATYERGDIQREALIELRRRGLWLNADQKLRAARAYDRQDPATIGANVDLLA